MQWFIYALFAAVFLAGNFLFFKQVNLQGVPVSQFLAISSGLTFLILFIYFLVNKTYIKLNGSEFSLIIAASVCYLIGGLLLFKSIATAPNPGYATAVGSFQVLILAVASIWLFGSEFSLINFFGAVLVVVGVAILAI